MKRISAARVCRLITGWEVADKASDKNLAQRLCLALGKLIAARELPVGALMPSERALAEALVVSRGTVVTAYGLLRDAQLVSSQQGSGYRIVASSNNTLGEVHNRLVGEVLATAQDIDMTSGALQSSPVLTSLLSGLSGSDLASLVSGLGYDAYGLPELRAAVARYYGDLGLPTRSEQILITSGAQQAVWLLANALVDSADTVLVEDPSYRGSMEAFRRRNARLIGTPVTRSGFEWEALEKNLQQRPQLFYCFADCQNPTGRSLDNAARERLAALLQRHPVFLVEDGSQCELRVEQGTRRSEPPTPLAALCDSERVATIGTLSKLFWGGLRVGWIRSSPSMIARLASMKAVNDLGSSRFDQRIAVELFERLTEARAHRQREISSTLSATVKIIQTQGGADWQWQLPDGGTALWIRIPGANAVALCQAAARQGVLLSAGPAYSVNESLNESFGECIRLPFVRSEETLSYTVALIRQLLMPIRSQEV